MSEMTIGMDKVGLMFVGVKIKNKSINFKGWCEEGQWREPSIEMDVGPQHNQ